MAFRCSCFVKQVTPVASGGAGKMEAEMWAAGLTDKQHHNSSLEKLPDLFPVEPSHSGPTLGGRKPTPNYAYASYLEKGASSSPGSPVRNMNGSGFVLTHWITFRIRQQVVVEITQPSTSTVSLQNSFPIIIANAVT